MMVGSLIQSPGICHNHVSHCLCILSVFYKQVNTHSLYQYVAITAHHFVFDALPLGVHVMLSLCGTIDNGDK